MDGLLQALCRLLDSQGGVGVAQGLRAAEPTAEDEASIQGMGNDEHSSSAGHIPRAPCSGPPTLSANYWKAMQRFAGQVVQAIMDNPWTRAWNNLMTDVVIRPVERLAIGVDEIAENTKMRLAKAIDMDMQSNGFRELSPEMKKVLEVAGLNPDGMAAAAQLAALENSGRYNDKYAAHEARATYIANTLDRAEKYAPGHSAETYQRIGKPGKSTVQEQAMFAVRDALEDGGNKSAFTDVGEMVRQFGIASPVAAYVGGGAGLYSSIQGLAALLASREEAPPEQEAPVVKKVKAKKEEGQA